MRRVDQPDLAPGGGCRGAEPRGAFRRGRRCRPRNRMPIAELHQRAGGNGDQCGDVRHQHGRQSPKMAQQGQEYGARHGGEHQVGGRRPTGMPGRDGLQRAIDHGSADDGRDARHCGQQAKDRGPARCGSDDQPRQPVEPGRHIGDDRRHALAAEPRAAPLAERAPGPLRMAEMEGRGDQAGRDQDQRQAKADHSEPSTRRQQPQAAIKAEPEQQAVPGPRRGGEEDDRFSWMHATVLP